MKTPPAGTVLAHLSAFAANYRRYLWTVLLYSSGLGLLGLSTPVAVQALVNTAAFGAVLQPIVVLSLFVLGALIVAGVLKALKTWSVEILQRRMFVDAVARLSYVLPRGDLAAIRLADLEQPTHRFYEVFTVQKAAASLLLAGIDAVLAALVGLLVLAFYHPALLGFDLVLMMSIAFIVWVLGKNGVETALEESSAKYRVGSFLTEMERAPLAFRDPRGEEFARDGLDNLCSAYLNTRASHFRVVLRQLIGALSAQALASAALLGLGGYLVIERELTLGQLVAAELIVTVIVSSLADLGKHLETYYDLAAGVYKLDRVLDLPIERESDESGLLAESAGFAHVVVSDLTVTSAGRPILEAASLTLQPGSRTRLVGAVESGKTSLLEVLYGLRRADRGSVVLDGMDTRQLTQGALRARVALVRGPEIVPGSVIDNVRLSRRDVSTGQVRALLDQLGVLEELSRLPDGLATELGPAGIRLSTSQALRITLARALTKSPGLLTIDANFSSMSAAAFERVMQVVSDPAAPWTLLVVGDGDQVRRHCPNVLRIERGRFTQEES